MKLLFPESDAGMHALVFRSRFFLLLGFAVLAAGIALFFFIRFLFTPNTGLIDNYPETVYDHGKLIFSPHALFSPAVASGLIPGRDEIIEVNREPVHTTRNLVTLSYGIKSFLPFPVTVIRDGNQKLSREIKPHFNLMQADWFFMFLLAFLLGFTGFYLLFHYNRNPAYFFLTCACTAYLLVICVKPFFYENTFTITLIHIGTFTPWLLVFYGLYIPRPKGKKETRIAIIILISSGYLLFMLFRIYYIHQWCLTADEFWFIQFRNLGKYNNVANGIAYIFFVLLLWHSCTITSSLKQKNQYYWLITGFIISLSLYYCIEELPLILGEIPGERTGSGNLPLLFLIPVPIFFLISLIWNKKIHIKTLQTGIVLHFLLLLFLLFCFLFLYNPLKYYFQGNNGLPGDMASLSAMLILFIALFPLYRIIDAILKPLIYGKNYKKSIEYAGKLEAENAGYKLETEQLKLYNNAMLQTAKMAELKHIVKGIAGKLRTSQFTFKKAITLLKHFDYSLCKSHYTATGQKQVTAEDYELFTSAVDFLQHSYLDMKKSLENYKTLFLMHTSVSCFVDMSFLTRKALYICQKQYPDLAVNCDLTESQKVYCLPEEILFALTALIYNAHEACLEPGARAVVRLYAETGKQKIEVEDEGLGILTVNKKRIFEPYFSTKAGHDGLGLYLAKSYIERNSGSLVFRNNETRGCVFTVILPGK